MRQKRLLTHAIDSQNNFVHINSVAKGLDCNCYCPSCKEKLIAKNGGTKRVHHFAHASGIECESAYETMLHILAKTIVQEAFFNKTELNIQFEYKSYCSNVKSCGFVKYETCYTSIIKKFNLKEFYDSCKQENQYDTINRRSDLKFFSSININTPPIYIEFCVTHNSDELKLHNGGRIIEVKIASENDLYKIIENGFIETSEIPNTTFWGFKSEDYNNMHISRKIEFSRYILYPSGKSQCYQDACGCKNLSKARKQSLLEICFHTPVAYGIYEMAKYQGYKKFGIKNCLYCKNYVNSYNGTGKLCKLYKHIGLNRFDQHDTAKAKKCQHFTLNEEEMSTEIQHFCSMQPNEYTILYETEPCI